MKYESFPMEYTKFNLKQWLKLNQKKISGRNFAKEVGMNYSYMYRIIDGKHVASYEMAMKIMKVVNKYNKE